jgi:hypothetical protein
MCEAAGRRLTVVTDGRHPTRWRTLAVPGVAAAVAATILFGGKADSGPHVTRIRFVGFGGALVSVITAGVPVVRRSRLPT